MALDSTPWFVGGGAHHSPEIARLLAYASTSGIEGIVDPSSLAVKAQSTPNGTVAVRPGAALILNRYAGGGQQTYVLRNASSTNVTIPATSSSGGRTDAIVARVLDPQYEGAAPTDPVTFQYSRLERIAGVSSSLTEISQLGLTYPAVLLARVNIPASTGTITSGMITDLRSIADPKMTSALRARAAVAADTETLTVTSAKGEWFPNAGAEQRIMVPSWAVRMIIEATWIQVREPGGNSAGECWVEYGPWKETGVREYSTQRFDWNTHNGTDVARGVWEVADYVYVPPVMRGTEQIFVMKGRVTLASAPGARPQIDAKSGVKMRVTFLQEPDPSTS